MSVPAPLILVVADRKPVTSGQWADIVNDGLPRTYLNAVEEAGGMPVILPPSRVQLANLDRLLDTADGVFLAGGRDLDAELYGRANHPQNDTPLRERDELEIALVIGAKQRHMPIFGACRGMQVLNVALGGTLEQHLADRVDMSPHRNIVGTFTTHEVEVAPASKLAGILQRQLFDIASHHHQAIDSLGEGLVPAAHYRDGVIEAVESANEDFALGVQWHPEEHRGPEGSRLFFAFIEAAAKYGSVRAGHQVLQS